jgi:hypothetical protein
MIGKPIPNPNAREGGKPASTFPPITARTSSRLSGDRGFFGSRRAAPTGPSLALTSSPADAEHGMKSPDKFTLTRRSQSFASWRRLLKLSMTACCGSNGSMIFDIVRSYCSRARKRLCLGLSDCFCMKISDQPHAAFALNAVRVLAERLRAANTVVY